MAALDRSFITKQSVFRRARRAKISCKLVDEKVLQWKKFGRLKSPSFCFSRKNAVFFIKKKTTWEKKNEALVSVSMTSMPLRRNNAFFVVDNCVIILCLFLVFLVFFFLNVKILSKYCQNTHSNTYYFVHAKTTREKKRRGHISIRRRKGKEKKQNKQKKNQQVIFCRRGRDHRENKHTDDSTQKAIRQAFHDMPTPSLSCSFSWTGQP